MRSFQIFALVWGFILGSHFAYAQDEISGSDSYEELAANAPQGKDFSYTIKKRTVNGNIQVFLSLVDGTGKQHEIPCGDVTCARELEKARSDMRAFRGDMGKAAAVAKSRSDREKWSADLEREIAGTANGIAEPLVEDCRQETKESQKLCDPERDPGLQAANMVGTGLLTQLNMATATNIQMACSGMGKFAVAANTGLMAFQGLCSAKWMSCSNKCADNTATLEDKRDAARKLVQANPSNTQAAIDLKIYEEALREIRAPRRDCSQLSTNIAGAVSNMGIIFGQLQTLKQCETLTANPLTLFCKNNPSAPLCGSASTANNTDCSNASVAATNTVCICAANPMDSRCGRGGGTNAPLAGGGAGGSGAGVDGGIGSGGLSGSGAMLGGFGSEGDFGDGAGGEFGALGNKNGAAAGQGGGRGGGGGGLGGLGGAGDTGGPGSNGKGGAGGSSINTKILSGLSSSGGSSGGSRYGGSGGSGGYGGGGAGQQNVDLRAFLPGGKLDPRRGIAGYSGPDGITGPNTDIWKKVKLRYNSVSPSLLP